MKREDVIETQFKALAMADELWIDRDSNSFKDFRRRVFENIQYLKQVEEDSRYQKEE